MGGGPGRIADRPCARRAARAPKPIVPPSLLEGRQDGCQGRPSTAGSTAAERPGKPLQSPYGHTQVAKHVRHEQLLSWQVNVAVPVSSPAARPSCLGSRCRRVSRPSAIRRDVFLTMSSVLERAPHEAARPDPLRSRAARGGSLHASCPERASRALERRAAWPRWAVTLLPWPPGLSVRAAACRACSR
jgi:hypothetical protein